MECIFCKIINGDIPSSKVYENEHVAVIRDINPVAPVHVLIIPKKHINNILEAGEGDEGVIKEMHKAVQEAAALTGVDKNGFRVIINCGKHGGQTVDHLHYHLIGGSNLGAKLI